MSDKQETTADISAWARGLVKPGETLENTYELLNGLADRIEAAHKREVGNGAKMREALDEIRVAAMSDYEPDADYLIEKCNAALFAPPRACDVLSANELKLQVFAGLAYQIKIKEVNIRGLEVLLRSVAGAVIDIAYDTYEEGETND